MSTVSYETRQRIVIITIERPFARNAVDGPTAQALYDAFKRFDADGDIDVAILQGRDGTFCAGADLKGVAEGRGNPVHRTGDLGPMGVTRLALSKPVIAAIEGHAVAGGLEVACWCDLRIAAEDAVFGVFCRRFGVPLIDLGTVRLPRLIGQSRAMDMILTGRPVAAHEALAMGWPTGSWPRVRRWMRPLNWRASSAPFRKPACAMTGPRPWPNGRWTGRPPPRLRLRSGVRALPPVMPARAPAGLPPARAATALFRVTATGPGLAIA